jgi:hypothetical protein
MASSPKKGSGSHYGGGSFCVARTLKKLKGAGAYKIGPVTNFIFTKYNSIHCVSANVVVRHMVRKMPHSMECIFGRSSTRKSLR